MVITKLSSSRISSKKTPSFNLIPLGLASEDSLVGGVFFSISASSLKCFLISAGDKGSKVIFLSLCIKVYVLVRPWCATSLSNSHGCPNNNEDDCIGTTSKSA